MRVRRHDAIGEGKCFAKDQLPPITFEYDIKREEGYLTGTEHFWKFMGSRHDSEDIKEVTSEVTDEDFGEADSIHCSDKICQSRFKTNRGLEAHILHGNHNYYKDSQSITDYGQSYFL